MVFIISFDGPANWFRNASTRGSHFDLKRARFSALFFAQGLRPNKEIESKWPWADLSLAKVLSKDQSFCRLKLMPAWIYIIRLKSGQLYIGSTTNLENRYKDHCSGKACRTTKIDPPVAILYTEELQTFSEARRREAQVKRWARSKKEALVSGDLTTLRKLSKSHQKTKGSLWAYLKLVKGSPCWGAIRCEKVDHHAMVYFSYSWPMAQDFKHITIRLFHSLEKLLFHVHHRKSRNPWRGSPHRRNPGSQIVDDSELPVHVFDGHEPHSMILGSLKIAIYPV